MKFGVVKKSTILNRFVLHTLQRNITHLDVIARKTNIKLGILKGGAGKEPCHGLISLHVNFHDNRKKRTVKFKNLGERKKSQNLQDEQSFFLRPFIHGGKDQHKSCTAHHGEPLLCP